MRQCIVLNILGCHVSYKGIWSEWGSIVCEQLFRWFVLQDNCLNLVCMLCIGSHSISPFMMLNLLLEKCMCSVCWYSATGRFSLHEGKLLNLSARTISLPHLYCIGHSHWWGFYWQKWWCIHLVGGLHLIHTHFYQHDCLKTFSIIICKGGPEKAKHIHNFKHRNAASVEVFQSHSVSCSPKNWSLWKSWG